VPNGQQVGGGCQSYGAGAGRRRGQQGKRGGYGPFIAKVVFRQPVRVKAHRLGALNLLAQGIAVPGFLCAPGGNGNFKLTIQGFFLKRVA